MKIKRSEAKLHSLNLENISNLVTFKIEEAFYGRKQNIIKCR